MGGFDEWAVIRVATALTSSLNLKEVLSTSYEALAPLLAADYAAICVSKPDMPTAYDWVVEKIPKAFFARYAELADGDFVRLAVMKSPNKVLRDSEMLPRAALKRSTFYRYCRELQMPLEYVMAVLLDVGREWHGGFTLYRESPRRPFSNRERRLLQSLTPALASTVRNCRMVAEMKERGELLETLFHHVGLEKLVLVPRGPELMRTDGFTPLMMRWFAPMELNARGLPSVLMERLERLAALQRPFGFGEDCWQRQAADRALRVTFIPVPETNGRRAWALCMEEVLKRVPMPQEWLKLFTPRELEVLEWMLRGVENQSIAEQLGMSINTVKTHQKHIYAELSVPNRAKLVIAAQEALRRQ